MVQRVTEDARAHYVLDSDVQIGLLGPLTIIRKGEPIELSGPKRRALLTFLALHLDTPLGREQIIEALWPKRQTGREESTLRVHISHLRDVLEVDRRGEPKILLTRGQSYQLSGHAVRLDLQRFESLSREARTQSESSPKEALQLLDEALSLWRGRPLQDVEYEEFAQDTIRRLEQARLHAIEDRAEALIAVGEDAAAIQDLEPLVRSEPVREPPTALLMRALYRSGRQPDALRVARRHRRHLGERGLEPSPRLVLLEEQILGHDPTLLPEGTLSLSEVRPGRSVRGYELREEAGRGSIGVVYRAYQPAVGREVALKVIDPEVAGTSEFVRRFAEEARVVAALEHPHIVPLYDFWREPNGAFLVMRWMEGGSLADRLGSPRASHQLALVFDQLANALGYAHSCGVVHRDVKPENVLFDSDGNAYLCDFGLAVTGVETGGMKTGEGSLEPPYASPELARGEGPTVASDIFGLGVLLAEAASGAEFRAGMTELLDPLWELVSVATAANPADRYPDMAAFRLALREAVGEAPLPAPRSVRRNPFKALEPFDEGDTADFYGRDDVVDTLMESVASKGLVAIIGASGSGKSSVVKAGLIPALRDGAIPGSDEWFIISMVPGRDPFEEFHIGLRAAAVSASSVPPRAGSREMRESLAAALDGPHSRALLVVDQFEELFSSDIDGEARERFLDNLVDLVSDPAHSVRAIIAMRADFSDRPLAHPVFGELFAKASYLLAPMRPEQVEDVIRGPAGRVGVQVEPGLISEIVRDVADAPAYLPLLQYILSELFERRTEDRLTVQAYRSLGGVEGVLERRAEATFSSLSEAAKRASRQFFLRMVHLGEHGEETRRRLPLTEFFGLGSRVDVDEALEAFSAARLLTYDRDPVSRAPTVEVAHETVIGRWTRYRVWIDEARADLLAHRRLSAAAHSWSESGEDSSYLLSGGPLAAALDVATGDRVHLNEHETFFVEESRRADEAGRKAEEDRSRQEAVLVQRSRRRLLIGLTAAIIAVVVGVLAIFAILQRQRANDLAAAQERQRTALELAAASVANLDSADPDLSLLLAVEAADLRLESDEEVLPEVVEALHLALINPRSEDLFEGAGNALGGNVLDYSQDGEALAVLAADGGAVVIDPSDGRELGRIPGTESPAVGVAFHPSGDAVLTTHPDAVRQWDWLSGRESLELVLPGDTTVTTASYSKDGSQIAVGGDDGAIRVFDTVSGRMITQLGGHEGGVTTIDFDNSGGRLVSGGNDRPVLVWDISSGEVVGDLVLPLGRLGPGHISWNPVASSLFAPQGAFAITTEYGEMWLYRANGERINSYGNGNNPSRAVAFSPEGSLMVAAGGDGVARVYGTWTGGEEVFTLASGGVPLRDAEFNPAKPFDVEVATVGVDGKVRIWRDLLQSELPARHFAYIAPDMAATPDGSRYVIVGRVFWYGLPDELVPMMEVIDAASGETLVSRPSFESPLAGNPAVSADGRRVSFTGPSGDIEVIDIESEIRRRLPNSAGRGWAQAFSADGTILATAGSDGAIAIWDVNTAELIGLLEGHGNRVPMNISVPGLVTMVEQLAFRPKSSELASVGRDGTVRIWDPTTGQGRVLRSFDYEVISLAYSPDGTDLAVAERTGEIHLLDSDTGKTVLTPDPVSGPPARLVFSPDGELVAGAGPGHYAHLWEIDTGRLVRRLQGSLYAPMEVAFVNEGRELLVLATEGILRRYLLDPDDLVELARSEVSRQLTEEECERYLGAPCPPRG